MTRREFMVSGSAAALAVAVGKAGAEDAPDYAKLQAEIDAVTPSDFRAYLGAPRETVFDAAKSPAFARLDAAFDKVRRELAATKVTDTPAVWLVYNMGVIVKTAKSCFSIDLMHRKAEELADQLDFALISHNHLDHYTEAFYRAMDRAGKVVVSNFKDNYGVRNKGGFGGGGYTRAVKTFGINDVTVRTTLTDHNAYLVDFTTAFEIQAGKSVIYHTGDCSNLEKLKPSKRPDLWIVHPRCGMKVGPAAKHLKPKLTVIGHLNELGHARDKWRWTYADGLQDAESAKAAGVRAIVPTWGERLA